MPARGQVAEYGTAPRRGGDAADGAFLFGIVLYALLVMLLIGQNVLGRGLPLVDGYGRLAVMTPVGGIESEFDGSPFTSR